MSESDDLELPPRVRPGGRPRHRAEAARSAKRRKPPKRDRAEYMRNYRAAKDAERQAAADEADEAERKAKSGIDPETGVWTPRYPGQRPPFTRETMPQRAAMTTGAKSPMKIAPIAAHIKTELLSAAECPDYLKDPIWGPAIDSWAHAEAVVRLLREWLDQHDIGQALSEFTEEDETIQQRGNKTKRRSRGRRVSSVIEQLRQAEQRANTARQRLGLDPLARARLGKDIMRSNFDLAAFLAETAPVGEVRALSAPAEEGESAEARAMKRALMERKPPADPGGESGPPATAGQ